MIESLALSKSTLSEITPELLAAHADLATADQQGDAAKAVLRERRAALNIQAAKVNALRESLQRAVSARRKAVGSAELKVVILAAAVDGIGHMAEVKEQARFSAEGAPQMELTLFPALRQPRETDRAISSAPERLKGKELHVPGLAMVEVFARPDGFSRRGQRFTPVAEGHLNELSVRAWANAPEEALREQQQAQQN